MMIESECTGGGCYLPGFGWLEQSVLTELVPLETGGEGLWRANRQGVLAVFTLRDRKVDFAIFADRALAYVKSALGYPAVYDLPEADFELPAEAVLMDLDGTSVRSESFWIWIIERTTARLLGAPDFQLSPEDEPYVSGHSVSEHLQYCLDKYCPGCSIEEARAIYYEITRHEMAEVMAGRGKADAFTPSPGLKEFLLALKEHGIKIGLVTSGLYEKAWPEILAAFRRMGLGDPLAFYDTVITAGQALRKGQAGTLGELAPKPHPWLYAEAARIGLGIDPGGRHRVLGIEDSGAGVVAIRLAGFAAIGVGGGNIAASGARPLLWAECESLLDTLPIVLGGIVKSRW